ncbi:MAG: hypothetical protein OEY89_00645 [Gammaproteobacteria bacterium]|nr:hypothetical protein [Gammaproteobacteria bacterium]
MLTITVISLGILGIFYIGYYFGNQMGRTESIRHHLAEIREHNQIR